MNWQTTIRAEMARHGLLGVQLGSYEDPDTRRTIIPREEPDTIAALWEFRDWLERLAFEGTR